MKNCQFAHEKKLSLSRTDLKGVRVSTIPFLFSDVTTSLILSCFLLFLISTLSRLLIFKDRIVCGRIDTGEVYLKSVAFSDRQRCRVPEALFLKLIIANTTFPSSRDQKKNQSRRIFTLNDKN